MLSPILLATFPLLAIYLYTRLRYYRLKQFAAFPQLKPSLIWGHLKVVHLILMNGQPKRHIGIITPPFFLLLYYSTAYRLACLLSDTMDKRLAADGRQTMPSEKSESSSATRRFTFWICGPSPGQC